MAVPIDLGKVKSLADNITKNISKKLVFDVFYDNSCSDNFTASVRDYFMECSEGVALKFVDISESSYEIRTNIDLVIILAGENPECADIFESLVMLGVNRLVISVNPSLIVDNLRNLNCDIYPDEIVCPSYKSYSKIKDKNGEESIDFSVFNSKMGISLKKNLSKWFNEFAERNYILYGQKFPQLRSKISLKLVNECAIENSGIGAVKIFPGKEMSLVALNQVRMLLELAAIYGYNVNEDRIIEIVLVVASSVGIKKVIDFVKKKKLFPNLLIDWSISFSSTYIIGSIARKYFASGIAIDGLVDKCVSFFKK